MIKYSEQIILKFLGLIKLHISDNLLFSSAALEENTNQPKELSDIGTELLLLWKHKFQTSHSSQVAHQASLFINENKSKCNAIMY